MATPTGTTPTSSSAANKRPAGSGNVTTPSHLSHHTSPAPPRSVPSPATARSHTAGKTPTSSSQQGSKTLAGSGGGTPMMRNLSQATSNPSPSAAGLPSSSSAAAAAAASAAGGGTAQHHHSSAHLPATPSLLPGSAGGSGVGSAGPGPGSVPMGPSLSEMGFSLSLSRSLSSSGGGGGGMNGTGLGIAGIGSSGLSGAGGGIGGSGSTGVHRLGGANEDSLRRTRLRKILGGLARPAGRVSEEGIARVARRVGFAIDLDDGGGLGAAAAEAEGRIGNRTITVAGNTVMIELDLKNNIPRSVNVAVNGGGEAMREEEKRAGEVLLRGLRVPDESGGGVCGEGLGCFAGDLEALARIDRLSSQRISCFEALSGVYGCLRRLWKVELEAARDELKKSRTSRNVESSEGDIEDRAEELVMEKKSGMPLAHSRGRIGWELVYWQSERRGTKRKRRQISTNNDDMEIDGGNRKASDTSTIDHLDDGITFSLQLETESSPAGLFPSLRISDAWLPEDITLPPPDSAESLPWQDPPPTFLAPDDNADAMAVDGGPEHQKIPDLRFVARLEPALVLPYPIAVQILASVGLPAPNVMTLPPQYAAAAIDPSASAHVQPGTFSHSAKQTVLSMADGKDSVETHVYTLDTAKPDWSYTLHEIPYSHPRQLVDLLPTLRQWAQVGTLLRQALAEEETPASSSERLEPRQPAESKSSTTAFSLSTLTSAPRKPDVEMAEDSAADKSSTSAINILLNTAPVPTFKFTFPPSKASESASTSSQNHKQGQHRELANVTMQVLANAELAVVAYDGLDLPPAKHAEAGTEQSKEDDKDGDKEDKEQKEAATEDKKRDEGANNDEKPAQSEGETSAQEAVDKENGRLKQRQDAQKRLAGALAICGDCRIWVEWMRNMA